MGRFKSSRKDFYICEEGYPHIKRERFHEFAAGVLGLGDLTTPTRDTEAIAAVFDLEGFTKFCTQIDPHLAISEYLAAFLAWLFDAVKRESCVDDRDSGVAPLELPGVKKRRRRKTTVADDGTIATFATLPFFAKFMGDGVLFLWDAARLSEKTICSIPAIMTDVCATYYLEFLPRISRKVADPPANLRCGIARGKVFSVGNGNDFVGPCINMASRLQKLGSIHVAFSRRGFNADDFMDAHKRTHFVLKKVSVRGIGENELVYVDRESYDGLDEKESQLFEEPDEDWRLLSEEDHAGSDSELNPEKQS
jgi:class 3 adenylate cyclase